MLPESSKEGAAEVETDLTPQGLQPDGNSTADSSPADDAGGKAAETDLQVLDKVLAASKPQGASPASESDREAEASDGAEGKPAEKAGEQELPDEVTDEELKGYRPESRRRIKQLLGRLEPYKALGSPDEIAAFKESHDRWSRMNAYVQEANLSTDEVNTGFDIMKAMKNDPVAALQLLEPYVHALREVTGHVLPPDLQEKVRQGEVPEDLARRTAQAEAGARLRAQEATRAADRARELERQESQTRLATQLQSAVNNWEAQWKASDPDHAAKRVRVAEKIELAFVRMRASGQVPTVEQSVQMAQQALDAVNEEFKALRPTRPKPIDPPISGAAASGAQRAPQNPIDVIDAALRRTAAR